ncbi:lipid-transfer protein [Bradyrhizobium sp. 200]|uniref:lipid-transfer protein n=1 Tax=Bradyrhizobium sp. 200 TaxID=2782665 RepID=UPI001FFE4494|nr:lipid-transfer protein [Bradyrhizobium sp. 200]UPJ48414.1 lipid-transfer protein [Bradyrhizobium sp. 200]
MKEVLVAGVGMTPFRKPGDHPAYHEMAAAAVREALADAGIAYVDVQEAYAGYVFGDSACGQRCLYEVGMSGIPIINVNNNCASGSTAFYLARKAIASGAADCVLAVGFEQMQPGALGTTWADRPSPLGKFDAVVDELYGRADLPVAIRYFAAAGKEYMERYGTSLETFAKVRAKASEHAANNPLAVFRKVVTPEEVLASPPIVAGVLTKLMACPPTSGAAAVLLVSRRFAATRGIRAKVQVLAQALATDTPSALEGRSMTDLIGAGMVRQAARSAFEEAGVGPEDVDVCELHDCFAQNEVFSYENLGLCSVGGAEKFVNERGNTYGGDVVVNPSGGLLSKGHPLGATGLAQCYELTHQLRGTARSRQVPGARIGLQHNAGLGGAVVVTLFGSS